MSKEPFSFRRLPSIIYEALSFSPEDIGINVIQIIALLILFRLARIPSMAQWAANLFEIFPHHEIHSYDPMSAPNWIVHFVSSSYNICLFRSLLSSKPDGFTAADLHKRKMYALVVCGISYSFGLSTLVHHSLIGTGSVLEQGLANFSHFFIQLTVMTLGCFLLFPPKISCVLAMFIARALWVGQLPLGNGPAIVLTNLGLITVLASPNKVFPVEFKVGYIIFTLIYPIVSYAERNFGAGNDLVHTFDASFVTLATVLQKHSMMAEKTQNDDDKKKKFV